MDGKPELRQSRPQSRTVPDPSDVTQANITPTEPAGPHPRSEAPIRIPSIRPEHIAPRTQHG